MTTIYQGETYRFSFLTPRLVRLEYHPKGRFEDRPTTLARCRDFPPVEVTKRTERSGFSLDTPFLHLSYDGGPFSPSGLTIALKGRFSGNAGAWRFGERPQTLGGTARTLDRADGEIPVEEGILSRKGFSVLDDSSSPILLESGEFLPREDPGEDLYFFGYGHDYQECLRDFYRLTGPVPLLPRFALGNWWSRYHEYSEESYLSLMDRFEREGIPLSVAVIDMDWHVVKNPWHSGWTGYTWNRALFPDPERFLSALHQRGLRVTLNLHPADGTAPHEEGYQALCRALGREEGQTIDFDAGDEDFLAAYLSVLHHPLEDAGVDFWWIDWQQGTASSQKGLDPLWVLNEKHYRDSQRKGKRGLILSRYAGPGSHRCPVGFSGDTVMSWASLAFQPRFTAMASAIGYPWWSHDIGGHMRGIRNDELTVRWLWLGVFSPILRLHSSKSEFMSKEPWTFGYEAQAVMGKCLRLRHRLLPYLYTACEETHRLGIPLVRPLYFAYPERDEAYRMESEFFFGPSLLVCPLTEPADPALTYAKVKAFLPEGLWFDMETGLMYTGDRQLTLHRRLDAYPVLAPAGGILPLSDDPRADALPAELTLRIFAGADGHYVLYEDDGESLNGPSAKTSITLDWENKWLFLQTEGDLPLPERRTWHVELIGSSRESVLSNGKVLPISYDERRGALCFTLVQEGKEQEVFASFPDAGLSEDDWRERTRERLLHTQTDNAEKDRIWSLLRGEKTPALAGTLLAACQTPGLAELLLETVFARA